MDYQLVISLAAVGAAGGALWTAIVTRKVAEETRKAAEAGIKTAEANRITSLGQIVNLLEREYDSNEMMRAIHRVKKWKAENGTEWIEKFIELREKDPTTIRIDEARRYISNYFYRFRVFLNLQIIDLNIVQEIIKPIRVELFFDYIDPLEKKLPKYDISTNQLMEEIRALHEKKRKVKEAGP